MAGIDARGVIPQLFTGWLLRRAYVVSRDHAQACIGDDVTIREVPALSVIAGDEPLAQRRLGVLLDLNRTTTGKLVDALMAKGWVARAHDPDDRRSYVLRITAAGREALARLHRSLEHGEADLTKPLTADEHQRLATALRALLAGDTTVDIQGLGTRCGYLIARAHFAMFRKATDALRPLGISPRDFGLLAALAANQPCSQQRLAEVMGMSAPAILAFVDELEGVGLVERRRKAGDRRAYDLTLTSTGMAKLDAARVVALDVQADIAELLGPDLDRDLRALLAKVIGLAAPPPVARPDDAERQALSDSVDLAAS
jgi:DNA-binding MarR family transcriptional regulator